MDDNQHKYMSQSQQLVTSPRQFKLPLDRNYPRVTPMDLREVAGLTKVQLAAELGLSVRTINDWEQNRSQPKLVPSQLKQMMSSVSMYARRANCSI